MSNTQGVTRHTETQEATEAGTEQEGSKRELDSQDPDLCPSGVTVDHIETFLLNVKHGIDDDTGVAEHLAEGCAACEREKMLIFATNPYVRGPVPSTFRAFRDLSPREKSSEPSATEQKWDFSHIEESPETDDNVLRTDVARGLAAWAKSPALPFRLKTLWEMAKAASSASDAGAAGRIAEMCQQRYERLSQDNRQAVVAAAKDLMNDLAAPSPTRWKLTNAPDVPGDARSFPPLSDMAEYRANDSGILRDGVGSASLPNRHLIQRSFLVYFMGREWFLNPGRPVMWGLVPETPERDESEPEVVLYFDYLRAALARRTDRRVEPPKDDIKDLRNGLPA